MPSMIDVAQVAGVSPQTVSRVSTGSPNVLPQTRARVLEAMQALGYVPNAAARALKYGSFQAIGLIAHRLARAGESRTVDAVVDAARSAGYTVNLVDVQTPSSHGMTHAITQLGRQSMDGLIIIRAETFTPDTLVAPGNLPIVVSDSRFAGQHPIVISDQAQGTRLAVEHLLGLGHDTVHHLAGPADSLPARVREQTWRETLRAAGRRAPRVVRGDWSVKSGYEAASRLLRDPHATCVFCANDQMALGLIRAAHEAGRHVPGDLSVVGFDDIDEAAYFWPPLTTVHQDFARIGRELVQMLLTEIHGQALTQRRAMIPVELAVRASTAPPGRPAGQGATPAVTARGGSGGPGAPPRARPAG